MVKNLVLWLVIAAVLLTVFNNFSAQQKTQPMNYSQFIELVQSGQVRQVVIDGLHFEIETSDQRKYSTVRPMVEDPKLMDELINNNVTVIGKEPEKQSIWSQLLVASFPILVIIAVFMFFMRQMQGGVAAKGRCLLEKAKRV